MKEKSSIVRLRDLPLRRISRMAFQSMLGCSRLFRYLGPQPETAIRWDEFRNKLRAFLAFEYAELEYGLTWKSPPLEELITRADVPESQLSIFSFEGIGYWRAKLSLSGGSGQGQEPLLKMGPAIPAKALIPLHVGMGVALAESLLRKMDNETSAPAALLQHFAELCQANALPGYAGITFEALGFVARTLYPHLIIGIDALLAADEKCLAYFWHGAGRGIYFAPENAAPRRSAPWNGIEMCAREPAHDLGRRNALAGFAWALTWINFRQPEIMATVLRHHGQQLNQNDAFASGVRSAATAFREMHPDDGCFQAFANYIPDRAQAIVSELWDDLVKRPVEDALQQSAAMKKAQRFEELFRYIP